MKKLPSKPKKENEAEKAAQDRITQTVRELLKSSFTPFWWVRFLTILIILSVSIRFASAQRIDTVVTDSSRAQYCFYMKQYKTFKTIGLLTLVPGVAILTTAAIKQNSLNKEKTLYAIGGIMTFISVNFLIYAGENKRKAHASLKIKTQKVGVGDVSAHISGYIGPALKIEF